MVSCFRRGQPKRAMWAALTSLKAFGRRAPTHKRTKGAQETCRRLAMPRVSLADSANKVMQCFCGVQDSPHYRRQTSVMGGT